MGPDRKGRSMEVLDPYGDAHFAFMLEPDSPPPAHGVVPKGI
jgi:hypothetical protein